VRLQRADADTRALDRAKRAYLNAISDVLAVADAARDLLANVVKQLEGPAP
jgi:hypothetical protein